MSNDTFEVVSVSREIPAAPADIFNLLSNPERHQEFDGSGTVRSTDHGERLKKVGDTFRMNMTNAAGDDYQTQNEVYAFAENKMIGWINQRNVTKDVEVGSKWLYELEPQGSDATVVTLSYDPTELKSDGAKAASKNFTAESLEKSLAALADAVA